MRASFPPSNQCLHPSQHQWLVNEQDVYQSPKTTWLERTQATNACTLKHTTTQADTVQAGTDGGQHSFTSPSRVSLWPLSRSLPHTPSLMGAEKLQLIKDVNGGGE